MPDDMQRAVRAIREQLASRLTLVPIEEGHQLLRRIGARVPIGDAITAAGAYIGTSLGVVGYQVPAKWDRIDPDWPNRRHGR